jgi:hypothetical protein
MTPVPVSVLIGSIVPAPLIVADTLVSGMGTMMTVLVPVSIVPELVVVSSAVVDPDPVGYVDVTPLLVSGGVSDPDATVATSGAMIRGVAIPEFSRITPELTEIGVKIFDPELTAITGIVTTPVLIIAPVLVGVTVVYISIIPLDERVPVAMILDPVLTTIPVFVGTIVVLDGDVVATIGAATTQISSITVR